MSPKPTHPNPTGIAHHCRVNTKFEEIFRDPDPRKTIRGEIMTPKPMERPKCKNEWNVQDSHNLINKLNKKYCDDIYLEAEGEKKMVAPMVTREDHMIKSKKTQTKKICLEKDNVSHLIDLGDSNSKGELLSVSSPSTTCPWTLPLLFRNREKTEEWRKELQIKLKSKSKLFALGYEAGWIDRSCVELGNNIYSWEERERQAAMALKDLGDEETDDELYKYEKNMLKDFRAYTKRLKEQEQNYYKRIASLQVTLVELQEEVVKRNEEENSLKFRINQQKNEAEFFMQNHTAEVNQMLDLEREQMKEWVEKEKNEAVFILSGSRIEIDKLMDEEEGLVKKVDLLKSNLKLVLEEPEKELNQLLDKEEELVKSMDEMRKHLKNAEGLTSAENQCQICWDSERSHVIIPCGHFCLCEECSVKIAPSGKCPLCRTHIDTIRKVFE